MPEASHTTFSIVNLSPDHWPGVRAIYAEGVNGGLATVISQLPTWKDFDQSKRPDLRLAAVDDASHVLGWATCEPFSHHPAYAGVVEDSVYVAEAAQRRGIGRALLQALVDRAAACGVWTIQSKIFSLNHASIDLHVRLGFRLVGVYERLGAPSCGPYRGKRLDVTLLQRSIQ